MILAMGLDNVFTKRATIFVVAMSLEKLNDYKKTQKMKDTKVKKIKCL
jgi:hypothetical protein